MSTRATVDWASMYSGAVYTLRYRAPGVQEIIFGGSTTTANEAKLTNLHPNKTYTIDLYVVENGEDHLVSSLETDTTIPAPFSVTTAGHSSILMTLENPSDVNTSYYYHTNIKGSGGGFSVPAGETRKRYIDSLTPGTTYQITLYQVEHGYWIRQKTATGLSYLTQATAGIPDMSTSIGTTTAVIKWDQSYANAWYDAEIFQGPIGGGGPSFILYQDSEISGSSSAAGNERSVTVPSLVKNTRYYILLRVKELNRSGAYFFTELKKFEFRTSVGATLVVNDIFASYVDLSWVPGVVEEEDGVAEFKIRKIEYPNGSYTDATVWLPHTVTTSRLSGLKSGQAYRFALLRKGLDDVGKTHAIVNLTTKGTTLQVEDKTSSTMLVKWGEVYSNAQYQLQYTELNGSPVTFGGGSMSQTEAVLTGLKSNTVYSLYLYIIEDGSPVGVAKSALGSTSGKTTTNNMKAFMGVLSVASLVLAMLVIRMRK